VRQAASASLVNTALSSASAFSASAFASASFGTTARHTCARSARVAAVARARFGSALPVAALSRAGVGCAAGRFTGMACAAGASGLEGFAATGFEPDASEKQRNSNATTDFESKHVA